VPAAELASAAARSVRAVHVRGWFSLFLLAVLNSPAAMRFYYKPNAIGMTVRVTLNWELPLMLNYTTKIPAHQSIAEISRMLARAGAKAIMHEYDDEGYVISLTFSMELEGQRLGFRLPADWRPIQTIMEDMRRSNTKLERRITERQHCIDVAWRVIKDWVEAQLALLETRMVTTQQLFLPYAVTKSGETLYERIATHPQMLLGSGDEAA